MKKLLLKNIKKVVAINYMGDLHTYKCMGDLPDGSQELY